MVNVEAIIHAHALDEQKNFCVLGVTQCAGDYGKHVSNADIGNVTRLLKSTDYLGKGYQAVQNGMIAARYDVTPPGCGVTIELEVRRVGEIQAQVQYRVGPNSPWHTIVRFSIDSVADDDSADNLHTTD